MSEHNYDVIIIGGGPAELFAGIACARNELRTLVNSGNLVKAMFDYYEQVLKFIDDIRL
jgi:thioredoxin reductase